MSCSKYKAGDVIDGDDIVPPNPPFWTKFTLEGADADGDGVRDDVEIWINENIEDSNMRKLSKQSARTWDAMMKIQSTVDAHVFLAILEKRYWCLRLFEGWGYPGLNEYSKMNKVSDLFYNNYFRRKKVNEVGKFIPSYTMPRSHGNPLIWLKSCDFKIDGLKDIVKVRAKRLERYSEMTSEEKDELLRYMEN